MLSVYLNPKGTGLRRRRISSAAAVCAAVMLGPIWSSASAGGVGVATTATTPGSRGSIPYAERLPNLVLKTHEGKNVRFYEDLIKDKIVLINFMYVTCDGR